MEEGGINMADNGRQKAEVKIARSETFPRTCHPQRTSSGHQQRFSSIPSFPTTSYSYDKAMHRSSGPSFAGDTSGPGHSIMIGNPDAVVASSSKICQATTSGTSQGEEPSPSPTNGMERTPNDYCAQCVPLFQAAMKGDWSAAKAFLEKHHFNKEIILAPITENKARALHIAVAAQHTTFIKKLLEFMDRDDLELKTNNGFTALHSAAQVGNVRIAKQLFEMNNELLLIPDGHGDTPLIVAAYIGHSNMVSYLFARTPSPLGKLTNAKCIELLHHTICNDMYDVALKILKMVPDKEFADSECLWEALEMLARKAFEIGTESRLSFWKNLLNSSIGFKGIYNKALMKTSAHQLVEEIWKKVGIPDTQFLSNLDHNKRDLIFEAAKVGNVEFLIILARSYPDLIWQKDKNQMSIFHFAILYRHESVFKLIYEIGDGKGSLASYPNLETEENMLHLAGKLAPSDRLNIVSGAALQMQRELLWYKEIEKIVPQSYVNKKNKKGQTPKEIFIKAHKNLKKAGEKWMKDTANYCMLVATLIATVIFAATFNVPGGSNQETGTPIFLRNNWFMVFFISDAIALCSSSTSIVIFLSILTSRYTEEDFLKSLPSKLLFGLATLFISMAGMMVAFIATFFLVYTSATAWAPVVGITSASIPIISFVLLHCELWVDAFLSTYKSRFLFQPYKHRLF